MMVVLPGIKNFFLGRYGALLVVLVLLILLQPFVETDAGRIVFEVLFYAALFAGLRAVQIRAGILRFLIVILVAGLVMTAIGKNYDLSGMFICGIGLRSLFLSVVALTILFDLFTSSEVKGDTLAGAVCVYLLIAVIWTYGYMMTEYLVPESFSFTLAEDRLNLILAEDFYPFFYFSLVTMTTVGYGDMAPVSNLGRTMATLEAIVGQMYLTILVARLVGMHLVQQGNKRV